MRRRRTPATSTTIAPPEASRLRNGSPTSAPIQPPARPSVSKSAMIFSGPRTTCSRPSSDRPSKPQPRARRTRRRLCALADQRDADRDERDRHDVAAEAGEPADDRLDAAAEWAGEVEVDGQAEQHADGDEPDADELVLAAVDGLAKLGGGLATARRVDDGGGRRRGLGRARALAVVVVFDRLLG